jgi:hypothetical protein
MIRQIGRQRPGQVEGAADKEGRPWISGRRAGLLGRELYSTYGPTADTGGLFQNQAPVLYRYASIEDLLEAEARGGERPPLPGPGEKSPTERPEPPIRSIQNRG